MEHLKLNQWELGTKLYSQKHGEGIVTKFWLPDNPDEIDEPWQEITYSIDDNGSVAYDYDLQSWHESRGWRNAS